MPKSKGFIPTSLYKKIHAAVPIACVDLLIHDGKKHILLLKRKNNPEKGRWWLPGGRILKGESFTAAASRKLKQETGLSAKIGKQLGGFEYIRKKGYFPGVSIHMIAIIFLVKINPDSRLHFDSQNSEAKWFNKVQSDFDPYVKKAILSSGILRT